MGRNGGLTLYLLGCLILICGMALFRYERDVLEGYQEEPEPEEQPEETVEEVRPFPQSFHH